MTAAWLTGFRYGRRVGLARGACLVCEMPASPTRVTDK
jgi:hypothetical protein